MGLDDVKIGLVSASLFVPVLATVTTTDLPAWVLALKELGSVLAVIYLFWYTLTRALPSMQQRFDNSLRDLTVAHSQDMAAERAVASDMNARLLKLLEANLGGGAE